MKIRKLRWGLIVGVLLACMTLASGSANASPFLLSINGKQAVAVTKPFAVSGYLDGGISALPGQIIEIMEGSKVLAQTTTALDGTYQTSVSFLALGAHIVRAVAYRNTPLETESGTLVVTVMKLFAGVASIAAGHAHTCALMIDKTVRCWGRNHEGELGDGTGASSLTPVPVSGLSNVIQLSAGYAHTCALIVSGEIYCWGFNGFGQIGNGTLDDQHTPVLVSGLSPATSISAGGSFSCALISKGVMCWGSNAWDQLGAVTGGRSDIGDFSATPVNVQNLANVITLASGGFHSCVLVVDGSMLCWGDNEHGQLGDGTTINRLSPVLVGGVSGVSELALGLTHTCVRQGGSVQCWGYNQWGQLGNGTTTDSSVPVAVNSLSNATSLTAGGHDTCALVSSGSGFCWGRNDVGELGNGSTTDSSSPVLIAFSGVTATSIRSGWLHSCALVNNSQVMCWGFNSDGMLGDGTTIQSTVPENVLTP